MSTQVPVAPLLYGGAWSETSTRNYTGWPTSDNPYMSAAADVAVPGVHDAAPQAGLLTRHGLIKTAAEGYAHSDEQLS